MKKLSLFFLSFICQQASAQTTLIATQVKNYQVDRLDNVLYIDLKSYVTKIESTRLKTNYYAALASGSPEILDATNPFAIMVYYPSFFQVKILDVNLAEIGSYDLRAIYPNSFFNLVCTAPVNGFWAYDEFSRKLVRLDGNFQIKQQSQDLYLFTKKIIKPNFLSANNEFVYLNDPMVGIMVFDIFGSYQKTIPLLGLKKFTVNEGKIVYGKDGHILQYQNLRTDTLRSTQIKMEQFSMAGASAYWMQSDSLFTQILQ